MNKSIFITTIHLRGGKGGNLKREKNIGEFSVVRISYSHNQITPLFHHMKI